MIRHQATELKCKEMNKYSILPIPNHQVKFVSKVPDTVILNYTYSDAQKFKIDSNMLKYYSQNKLSN